MDPVSKKLNIPQINGHIEDSVTPSTNSKKFRFVEVPDYLGNGQIHIKTRGYAKPQNHSILLYCLPDNHDTVMTLNFTTAIQCTSARHYTYTPTQTECAAYYAIYVSNQTSYPSTLPAGDILTIPGYITFTAAGPYTPDSVIDSINTGVNAWVTAQQQNSLARLTAGEDPQLPSLSQTISELHDYGVPQGFFTTDVTNNIQILLNQYSDSFNQLKEAIKSKGPNAIVSAKHDVALGWGCWWCQVGFGIIITLLTCAITVALIALIPTGAGAAAIGGIAAYLVTWFDITAAVASTVAAGLIKTIGTVASVSIATILLNLPTLICEAIGTCSSS
ncbi:hypothetical protein PPL_07885 [Heterostelium album PN500]|uniref:Uncharacterized protein n=1 Tax=Heterostelium pallidum (strain ATCC 26659 / Pp 5 / PN500) TaxID=670386 RepID=D3BH83_HETP5|nr:hypothetical protein PPL_07885 [Heterostelium album PN500]EFA79467.1 hypothetical protein PPL_07885 [Heterostelium album PN500]|eukprot:XP_020431588.1 hypothetical protein PPL_07885 [Heterostelium album PN500]